MKNRIHILGGLVLCWGMASLAWATSADDSFNAGKKYYDQYLYDQAIVSFQEAVSIEPNYWEAYQMMSYSYYKQGKRDSALEAANKSLKIHRDNDELRKFMADHLKQAEMPLAPGEHMVSGVSEASAAEVKKQNFIQVNLGGSLPMSPAGFTSRQNPGYNLGLGVGIGITKNFQVVLDANMDNFPLNSASSFFTGSSITGGASRYWTFLGNGRLRLIPENNPVIPYAIGGLGLGLLTQDDMTITTSGTAMTNPGSSDSYLTGRIGLGLEFVLSDYASLLVEPDGIIVFSGDNKGGEDVLYGSFRIGGKFNL